MRTMEVTFTVTEEVVDAAVEMYNEADPENPITTEQVFTDKDVRKRLIDGCQYCIKAFTDIANMDLRNMFIGEEDDYDIT